MASAEGVSACPALEHARPALYFMALRTAAYDAPYHHSTSVCAGMPAAHAKSAAKT